jgi:2-polyprenyl-6-methoxyphenol hydroxylase-like FAD-dependent oxidoreductase
MAGQRHAEIAGGGIGGLAAAAALAQRGWTVRVHEHYPELRFIGAGIYIFDNGLRVLKALGAFEDATGGAYAGPIFEIRDRHNRLTERVPFSGSRFSGLLDRAQTTNGGLVAAGQQAGVEIVTNSEAVGATPEGELLLADGQRLRADLVVAADGVNSKLRDSLGLLKSRWRLADGAIRMLIPRSTEDLPEEDLGKYIEFWSGTRRILYTPCNDRDLYLAFSCLNNDLKARSLPIDKPLWQASLPHLAKLLGRIDEVGRWDPFEVVKLHRWSAGRVAILGDAAHAQAPNLGQGGGCAMMNALGLAVALEQNGDDIQSALEAWERRERPLPEHTQRIASIWSALTTWPDSWRSAAFQLVGKSAWLNAMRLRTARHVPTGTAP